MSESRKGSQNRFYGKHYTDENKQKQSENRKSRYCNEGNPFYGKKHTEYTKDKISKLLKTKFDSGELIPKKTYR